MNQIAQDNQCQKHKHPFVAIKYGKQNEFLCLLCLIELTKNQYIIAPLNDVVLQQIQENKEEPLQQKYEQQTQDVNIEVVGRLKQKEACLTISFNKAGNIMVGGCNQDIKVFEFVDNKLKVLTIIRGHSQNVTALTYSKEGQQFLSGSQDKQIKYWVRNQNMEWKCIQVLTIHSKRVSCLLLSKKDEFLFTSGYDGIINVLTKHNSQWQVAEKLNFESNIIYALSLNDSQTLLAATGDSSKIVVWQTNDIGSWAISQKISLNKKEVGFRLSFVYDDMIALQPNQGNALIIFQLNQQEKKSEKSNSVKLVESSGDSDSFPSVYIMEKNILVNKHSKHVYLLKKDDSNQFVIKNQIELPSICSYGAFTENLDYFIVWCCEEYTIYRLNNIV